MTQNLSDPNQTTDSTIGFFDRRECVLMNLNFAHAMLAARKRGQEHFAIGAVQNDTVLFPKHYPIEPQQSLMSSSAATCMDMAWGGELPDKLLPLPGNRPEKFR